MGVELEDTQQAPAASEGDRTATRDAGPPRPAAAASGLQAGKQLGHFRIDRPLGAGGMGEVYLATDLALDRPVAIKVLPEEVARDPRRRDRMIREEGWTLDEATGHGVPPGYIRDPDYVPKPRG